MNSNLDRAVKLVESLSYEEQYQLAIVLLDKIYPRRAEGFDVDIVFTCKEKVCVWLEQQLDNLRVVSKYLLERTDQNGN